MRLTVAIVGTIIVLGLAGTVGVARWNECRDAGFSVLYCLPIGR